METLTNKRVTCFLLKSNKYRRYYIKKNDIRGCNVHINLCPEYTFTSHPRFICHGQPARHLPVCHFPVLQIPVRQCQSFIFRPFCSVCHFPLRQFPPLQRHPSFSSPAFSSPANPAHPWRHQDLVREGVWNAKTEMPHRVLAANENAIVPL